MRSDERIKNWGAQASVAMDVPNKTLHVTSRGLVQTSVAPPNVRHLPIGVTHHRWLAALCQAASHPSPDLIQPRGLWVAIQVVVAIIGDGPGARLVVVPEDPRRRRCEGRDSGNGRGEADEVGKRFGKQPRGVCTWLKPGATWDKGFRHGGHRAYWIWPSEWCRLFFHGRQTRLGGEAAVDGQAGAGDQCHFACQVVRHCMAPCVNVVLTRGCRCASGC